ncbi:glycine--tRNA ligase [Patescibacteria group bacterium]|nr:glycine--tRNA ligase [Patescibacteria group bacterium]
MEKLVSLAKRRGFIFPSSEIYGGLASSYDYGPLGIELKNNVKKIWWRDMVQQRKDVFGLDAAILMHPKTWEASGHLKSFSDPLVDCRKCKKRFRADHILHVQGIKPDLGTMHEKPEALKVCPECGGELTKIRDFNLMFKTFLGPVEDSASIAYLRPETAQGIFVNYKNVKDSMRAKLPFGIAQIGKSFRNEITPGNFIFRTREFEQMELEYFVNPKEANKQYKYWLEQRFNWYIESLGIEKSNLRLRPHEKDELAHYATACSDIEYKFPFTDWDELEGISNRQDYDLKQHSTVSGEELNYRDEDGKVFIPYVIEPSAGVDRTVLTILVDAYSEISGGRTETTKSTKDLEVVMKFHKDVAPIKIAILPLVKKEKLQKVAAELHQSLKQNWTTMYDETASVGRRYRRQDEIGTPYCVTIDFETIEKDNSVTVRDRDTMMQERVKIEELVEYFGEKL